MQVSITTLTRRKNGSLGRREEIKLCESFRIGRNTKDELFLPDHRIPYNLATLHHRADGFFIEAEGGHDLRLNGNITQKGRVTIGDTVGIGPYDLKLVESKPEIDLSVTLELIHAVGDDVEDLLARSTLNTNNLGITKRALSWVLSLLILVLFLVLPILDNEYSLFTTTDRSNAPSKQTPTTIANNNFGFDVSWHSGELIDSHKFFANDCKTCHTKPFVMVENQACVSCHQETHGHFDKAMFTDSELNLTRCAACHTDHQGPKPLRTSQQTLCSSCHTALDKKAPGTKLLNASDFAVNHPQFKPTIWVSASTGTQQRISLDENPKENSNLKFPHKTHLNAKLMRNPATGKREQLGCGSCHTPDMSGQFLKPINMEEHCGDCHVLSFEPSDPKRLVSHGEPNQVYQELIEYYSKLALSGKAEDPTAPKILRRRPGAPLSKKARAESLKWAKQKTQLASEYLFSASQCGVCHQLNKDATKSPSYSIAPVGMTTIWQPLSVFDHSAHRDVSCSSCHAAEQSIASSDVLLPKIEGCRECHGGQESSNKIPSTCISCHGFHNDEIALMNPNVKENPK